MIIEVAQWEPLFFRDTVVVTALQNTSSVLPFRPATKQLFNIAPGNISLLVTFILLQTKFVGTNLNGLCLARRVDYMDVIHKEK